MKISRVVIKNFRCFGTIDVALKDVVTCVIGENNTGKSNFLHALRLCIDVNLPSSYRSLIREDFHSTVDLSHPSQVLVGLEITGFAGKANEEALVHGWQMGRDHARVFYRFRPNEKAREALAHGEREAGTLTLQDYRWEILGGGNPGIDLTDIEWDTETGSGIRFSDLQSFLVIYLPALRDVESELRQARSSPLARLIEASEITSAEQQALVDILLAGNNEIAASPTIAAIATAVDDSFKSITGPAFSMDVSLGLSDPSFQAIIRALKFLLSNIAMQRFEPARNGLGLNNILYVSIWIAYFHKRLLQGKSAGQIILAEEPEAHLHPQLQLTLVGALRELPFQAVLSTHSTHITSQASLSSCLALTHTGRPATEASVIVENPDLEAADIQDLERYLDATKSTLLFARKVMLVEGPAELFLIPALFKAVRGIDLERVGISVVAIYGVHFDVYAKLFRPGCLPKKCAIVGDADMTPSDATDDEDEGPLRPDLDALEGPFVSVFLGDTTFERELTDTNNLLALASAAEELGAVRIAEELRDAHTSISFEGLEGSDEADALEPLKDTVLRTAKRFGKARYAQVLARYIDDNCSIPNYIDEAVSWLIEQ
jgi:putative ATP-dependent endonuclease of OLD family